MRDGATDPALHGRVAIEATADHPEQIDRLVFEVQGAARVHPPRDRGFCRTPMPDAPFRPTLRLRVPDGFGVSIEEAGFVRYDVGAVGPLKLDLSGAGTVRVARMAGQAAIDLSGAATVRSRRRWSTGWMSG